MTNTRTSELKFIIGPQGNRMSIADLPAPDTQRWVIRRKAEIVAAVQGGLISLDEVRSRYDLTIEEFMTWQSSIDRHGIRGLKITRYDQYRRKPAS